MADFWEPFFFGFVWLVLAFVALWLLKRPASDRLSLRSGLARGLTWGLVVLALAIFVTDLPYSLGLCRGGFDDPVTCAVVPAALAEVTSALTILLVLAAVVVVPALVAAVLIGEVVKRR